MFGKLWNAVLGTSAALTEKAFDVYAKREERGVFVTQERLVCVGQVTARSIEDAKREVVLRFADYPGAYPIGKMEND